MGNWKPGDEPDKTDWNPEEIREERIRRAEEIEKRARVGQRTQDPLEAGHWTEIVNEDQAEIIEIGSPPPDQHGPERRVRKASDYKRKIRRK